jgi:predicted Mrr-cat superfamily restriction endonuclease
VLRLVLSDETKELLVVEKESKHRKKMMLDVLDIMALFLIKLLKDKNQRTKSERKALAHIRRVTKNLKNH